MDPNDIDPNAAPAADPAPSAKGDQGQAAPAAEAGDKSALADGVVADAQAAGEDTKSDWGDDWRERVSGGDEDIRKAISRYGSPQGMAKALVNAQKFIRSGKVQQDMPEGDDPKALAEWRKNQGVPENAESYKVPEVQGYQWTDTDKPLIAAFFDKAHSRNIPQSVADNVLGAVAEMQQDINERQIEWDKQGKASTEDALRKEWGGEYRGNLSLAGRFLQEIPDVGADWAEARMPDGRRLGNIPGFVMWASDKGRESFGDLAFIGGDGKAAAGDARIAEIKEKLKTTTNRDEKAKLEAEWVDLEDRKLKTQRAGAR